MTLSSTKAFAAVRHAAVTQMSTSEAGCAQYTGHAPVGTHAAAAGGNRNVPR